VVIRKRVGRAKMLARPHIVVRSSMPECDVLDGSSTGHARGYGIWLLTGIADLAELVAGSTQSRVTLGAPSELKFWPVLAAQSDRV
jgi:hypothetical protein